VLTVRDTGIGIEPAVLPHIFETFTQADRSLDRTRGGLGLGLALVNGLVALHGGEVQAVSEGPGRGAEFTVRLPLAPRPSPDPRSSRPAGASAQPLRILVIEDNVDAAESLRDLLEIYGCTVAVAYTGAEGVTLASSFQPDLILCDLGLPGMDGYTVAAALRRDPATAGARRVALSGYGDEDHRRRSHEAGFDTHLLKPVELVELKSLLETPPERD
jgi:CheY-like chemotaxis protein